MTRINNGINLVLSIRNPTCRFLHVTWNVKSDQSLTQAGKEPHQNGNREMWDCRIVSVNREHVHMAILFSQILAAQNTIPVKLI